MGWSTLTGCFEIVDVEEFVEPLETELIRQEWRGKRDSTVWVVKNTLGKSEN